MILLMTEEPSTPPIILGTYTEEGLRRNSRLLLTAELDTVISQIESLLAILYELKSVKGAGKDVEHSLLMLKLGEAYTIAKRKGLANIQK